ncbi:DUF29 domain-containing protein [Candidatus Marithrix sp. Canyon 246]|uniref:DUF29 domain-containing protein n=1 Tax=Candidatus Marithrix sp. Canyon 246 TaxID=1827136 RepID=UPI000849F397|nr:DUF29 domain-containing protein [Candidatus Marithrix sp. Canyon 246]
MFNQVLYEKDFYGWLEHTINLLKQGRLSELNTEILLDELESMAKRDRRELLSRLVILLAHLLKWQYQPTHRSNSWRGSIVEQRYKIEKQLEDSPSLKNQLETLMIKAYPDAVKLAKAETGLATSQFATACEYTIKQILLDEFYPG